MSGARISEPHSHFGQEESYSPTCGESLLRLIEAAPCGQGAHPLMTGGTEDRQVSFKSKAIQGKGRGLEYSAKAFAVFEINPIDSKAIYMVLCKR